MKLFFCVFIGLAQAAQAYEFRLQFSGNSQQTVGYTIDSSTVTGLCSSTRTSCSGSGRYRRCVTSRREQTCTWDLHGILLSSVDGAPVAPAPLSQNGTETIYATNGTSTTGSDSAGFGFVDTPSSHYTWQQASGEYAVVGDALTALTFTLVSDGDFDLNVASQTVTTQTFSPYNLNGGTATVAACAVVPVGSSCDVVVTYDPTSISCTGSPYGLAYTGIDLLLVTDAPPQPDFTERFTVTGLPLCDD